MNHIGTLKIESKRLILRKFTYDDIRPAFKNWMSDEKVTPFLTWKAHENELVTKDLISSWIKSYEKPNFYNWAIVIKDSKEPVGNIAAVKINEDLSRISIGYCLSSKHWSKGYMTEALSAVIEFFFNKVGANRIEARHDINNPASGKVMQKASMLYEGIFRENARSNRGIVDVCEYAILKDDYENK